MQRDCLFLFFDKSILPNLLDLELDPLGTVGWGWGGHLWAGIRLEFLQEYFYRFLDGRIVAFRQFFGAVHHFDVGIDADSLDDPLAAMVVNAETGHRDIAAIHQPRVAGDANQPAPGAGAD